MIYTLTPDQKDMRATVRSMLGRLSSNEHVRRAVDEPGGIDVRLWNTAVRDLGLASILVQESSGGLGLGWADVAIVEREMGFHLSCIPFFASSVLATQVLLSVSEGEDHSGLLEQLATGEAIASVAWREPSHLSWSFDVGLLEVQHVAGRVARLRGTKTFVPHGLSADVLLVAARDSAGVGVYRVQTDGPGVRRKQLPTLDATRPQCSVEFDGAEGFRLSEGDAAGALRHAFALAGIGLAAEQVGAGRRCVDMTVEYATMRKQFGHPIGSFQAVKHRLADAFTGVEAADAAVSLAADHADRRTEGCEGVAAVALAAAAEANLRAAADCVQLHGAMGFTEECDAQLYLKRAKSSAQLLGPPAFHRSIVADLVSTQPS